jgi:hypothetical protein
MALFAWQGVLPFVREPPPCDESLAVPVVNFCCMGRVDWKSEMML